MHPLIGLLATQPQLLTEHARAYAALFNEEFDEAFASWRRSFMLQAIALCCLVVAAVLGGVALMLWAVNPALQGAGPWVLLSVPLLPLIGAAITLIMAGKPAQQPAFSNLTAQLSADMAMLRTASSA
jgi:hypothetical protein